MQATMSYTKIGLFTLAGYPYSFKLLWSPIVDTLYVRRIGRRKSWILPLQVIAAVIMITCGAWTEARLVAGNAAAVTALFFLLVLLAATQDIAVDGWALTLLSKKNVGYAATCQTVGMNIGYFSSFTIFLALNDPAFCSRFFGTASGVALISLSGYMNFWGWIYLLVTAGVAFLKREGHAFPATSKKHDDNFDNGSGYTAARPISHAMRRRSMRRSTTMDEIDLDGVTGLIAAGTVPVTAGLGIRTASENIAKENDLKQAYVKLWSVVCLPSVRLLAALLIVCRLGMLPAETAAPLKLLEKGASKEALGGLVLVEFPIELASAVVAGRWAASTHPLRPWLAGYRLRLVVAAGTTLAVWLYPAGASSPQDAGLSFILLTLMGIGTSFASTLMFTALGDFYNRISDPAMGGTYLTLLNTLANVGVVVPKLAVFAAMDALTVRRCAESGDNNSWLDASCGPASAGGAADGECMSAGGTCTVVRDGFYILSGVAIVVGTSLVLWMRPILKKFEAMPSSAWRV
jgi:MFS transporter, PAT family, solute carrier family 33 (acetyl-CoA transportor), member 1